VKSLRTTKQMDQSNQSIFVVESCQNCKAHQWHTGHDEQKYIEYFNKSKY
jgi:hypothetical protein